MPWIVSAIKVFAVIISIIDYENALSSSIPNTLESCITVSILKMINGSLSWAWGEVGVWGGGLLSSCPRPHS